MNTSLVQLINAAFADRPPEQLPMMQKRGRRELWQLPHKWHCPIVGTCLTVAELRKLARRAGVDNGAMSDYTPHTAVVGSCDSRTEIAEAIQRHLDKRHAAVVVRYAQVKSSAAVLKLWREALAAGKVIYGAIHMLSHQVGAAVRGDLQRLTSFEQDNARLRDEAEALRHGIWVIQRDTSRQLAELERRLAALAVCWTLPVRTETIHARPGPLRCCPSARLRAGPGGAARRPQAQPLDVVRLSTARRARQ